MYFFRRVSLWIMAACFVVLAGFFAVPVAQAASDTVTIIHIEGEIDDSQTALVRRGIASAQARHDKAVVIMIHTLGGHVDSALAIRDILFKANVPTIAYIPSRAWSAGALLALSCRHIVMAPGSSLGAAEPIPATEKNIAALKAEFSATANQTGHNPQVAGAMVDRTNGYPDYAEPGQVLALTDVQARQLNVSEGTAGDAEEALRLFSLGDAVYYDVQRDWKDYALSVLQNPYFKMILVGLIFAALLAEIKMAGIGIGAITAVVLGGLLVLSGDSLFEGWLAVAGVFIGGILLIGLELAVPGIGIFGIAGVLMLFGSLFYMLGADGQAVLIMAGGLVVAALIFTLVVRRLPKSRLLSKLALVNRSTKEKGFISSKDYSGYLNSRGKTITILRPAGTIRIGKERVDAVSNGGFIDKDTEVKVIQIDGSRIVVEPVEAPSKKEG